MSFVKFQKANPLLIIYHITVGLSSVFDVNYELRAVSLSNICYTLLRKKGSQIFVR